MSCFSRSFRLLYTTIFIVLALSQASAKIDERWVTNPEGKNVFKLRFFNQPSDGPFKPLPPNGSQLSNMIFTEHQKEAVAQAFTYWAHVIKPPNFGFLETPTYTVVNLGQVNGNCNESRNACASGRANLFGKAQPLGAYGAHVYITFGDILRAQGTHSFTPLVPSSLGADLFSVTVHEFAHALFLSRAPIEKKFPSSLNSFEQGLRDRGWKAARPDMPLCETAEECRGNYNAFDKRSSKFQGKKVTEVLNGYFSGVENQNRKDIKPTVEFGLPLLGIPLKEDLAHTKLTNSLMSSDRFRNHSAFMEAELAMLEDLGYTIDRRNFFGYSVYGNYRLIANNSPFFDRTPDGIAYQKDTYNRSPLGVGLHVYGNFNQIVQTANILTIGPGAVGIRIDGQSNAVMVAPDVKIHSNGPYGRGLIVAYGKNHTLHHQGEIRATGQNGIGVSFNFGGTILGTNIAQATRPPDNIGEPKPYVEAASYSDEKLNGPLVKMFNITGSLEGSHAAIFIGPSAHVDLINIMGKKAQITGNIISNYNTRDAEGDLRPTLLTFGRKMTNYGEALKQADPDFDMIYKGAMTGLYNIVPMFVGGTTALVSQQEHKVYALGIGLDATLKANGRIIVFNKEFLNRGTLIPHNAHDIGFGRLLIQGDYIQTETGQLKIIFDPQATSSLSIAGNANLKGSLHLNAKDAFYPDEWICPDPFLEALSISGDFTSTTTNSPTLEFTTLRSSHEAYQTYHVQKKGTRELPRSESSPAQIQQSPINVVSHTNETESAQGGEKTTTLILEPGTDVKTGLGAPIFSLAPLSQEPHSIVADLAQDAWISEELERWETRQSTNFGFSRPWNAYSRYGVDQNGQAVGHMLRRLVRSASGDSALETLYKTLDFSARDGSHIRVALSQMTPSAYSAVFSADVNREQQVSDVIRTLPSWNRDSSSVWQVFALPFGERMRQNSTQDLRIPYTGTERGLVFGVEHRPSPKPRWLWGMHGLVGRGDISIKSADTAHVKITGADLGVHVRYEERPDGGGFLTGQARVGFQRNKMTRQLGFGSYGGPITAQWTSWGTTAAITGGYLFKLLDTLSLGPILGCDLTMIYFPTITENSLLPTALKLADNSFYSIRSQLGLKGKLRLSQKFTLEAQATWNQDLLDKVLVQWGRFAAYPKTSFLTENSVLPGQTMTLQAQVTYGVTPHLMLAARGARTLRSGTNITMGQLSGVWTF